MRPCLNLIFCAWNGSVVSNGVHTKWRQENPNTAETPKTVEKKEKSVADIKLPFKICCWKLFWRFFRGSSGSEFRIQWFYHHEIHRGNGIRSTASRLCPGRLELRVPKLLSNLLSIFINELKWCPNISLWISFTESFLLLQFLFGREFQVDSNSFEGGFPTHSDLRSWCWSNLHWFHTTLTLVASKACGWISMSNTHVFLFWERMEW